MGGNVVSNLCSLPATDLNFTSELNRATAYQIKQAIETMKQNGGKNKGRIKACDRELENRRLTKKDKHGKYVSKEHLSILCNTFSSEHRLKAILNKLGEYEDAERQGVLLQLPCKEVNRMDNKWVPVSERLPECCGYPVLLTVENEFNQRFVCKAFTNYMKEGKPLFYTNEKEYCKELTSSKLSNAWKPIAWMPLPEPYSADSEKPKTNADMIRNMSDEELAEFLCKVKSDYQWMEHEFPSEEEHGEWEEWLQSEAE